MSTWTWDDVIVTVYDDDFEADPDDRDGSVTVLANGWDKRVTLRVPLDRESVKDASLVEASDDKEEHITERMARVSLEIVPPGVPTMEELLAFTTWERELEQAKSKNTWSGCQEYVFRMKHGIDISDEAETAFMCCHEDELCVALGVPIEPDPKCPVDDVEQTPREEGSDG